MPTKAKRYYFSCQLKEQLAKIPLCPLTVIEAPSGFGKTTAVREYLKSSLHEDTRQYWYTCLGESNLIVWRAICTLLSHADPERADCLKNVSLPTVDTLMYIEGILRRFRCMEETYFVVDNYQLAGFEIPRELLSVLSMHGSPHLHMIFITQNLGIKPQITFHNANIHTIDSSFFFFDKESTADLFRLEGIRLDDDDLNKVYASTEGWISAIRLQILGYQQSGSFDYTADIFQLVENAIWNRLTSEEKEFLVSVSMLESFTVRQAALMTGKESLPENIRELLKTNDFIRFFPRENTYSIHGILQSYLRNQFYNHLTDSAQERILRIAGQCYAADMKLMEAAQLFYKIKDFKSLLSLPFSYVYLFDLGKKHIVEFAAAVLNGCPEETLCEYPFVLLLLSYTILLNDDMDSFQKCCRLINTLIETNRAGLSKDELRRLQGEFLLLMSFAARSDFKQRMEGEIRAYECLKAPSSIVSRDVPSTFGNISILSLVWRESGRLDEILMEIDQFLPHHIRITRGQGTGMDSAVRAQVALMRGKDDYAEILCHKALYEARSKHQISVCICAEFTMARIAILRGDAEGYFTSVQNIQHYANEYPRLYVMHMVDLCFACLGFLLGKTDGLANWLCDINSIAETVSTPALPLAEIIYTNRLLKEKRYNEFLGISQSAMEAARKMDYLLPQVYLYILQSIAKYNTGNKWEALEYFTRALHMALPDELFLLFALPWKELDDLLMAVKKSSPELYNSKLEVLLTLRKRQAEGVSAIQKALIPKKSPLTPREREVALLARERLSKKEIADKLYISDLTVKTILQNIYSKLDVHSKAELSKIDL